MKVNPFTGEINHAGHADQSVHGKKGSGSSAPNPKKQSYTQKYREIVASTPDKAEQKKKLKELQGSSEFARPPSWKELAAIGGVGALGSVGFGAATGMSLGPVGAGVGAGLGGAAVYGNRIRKHFKKKREGRTDNMAINPFTGQVINEKVSDKAKDKQWSKEAIEESLDQMLPAKEETIEDVEKGKKADKPDIVPTSNECSSHGYSKIKKKPLKEELGDDDDIRVANVLGLMKETGGMVKDQAVSAVKAPFTAVKAAGKAVGGLRKVRKGVGKGIKGAIGLDD